MKLKLERGTGKTVDEVTITSDSKDYLMIVCVGLTQKEHRDIKDELEDDLDIEVKADIYFVRNFLSVYIFDVETSGNITNAELKELIPDIDHRSVLSGAVFGNSKIGNINVTMYKGEVKIGKKYQTLLTMRKE